MREVVYRRTRHVIGEIERTVRAAERIRASKLDGRGSSYVCQPRSLRDDYDSEAARNST